MTNVDFSNPVELSKLGVGAKFKIGRRKINRSLTIQVQSISKWGLYNCITDKGKLLSLIEECMVYPIIEPKN